MFKLVKLAGLLGLKYDQEKGQIDTLREKFAHHVNKYSLSFGTKEEYEFRFEIYKKKEQEMAEAMVAANEDGKPSFTLDHNRFSTLTDDEFKKYLGKKPDMKKEEVTQTRFDTSKLTSDGIDWRQHGAVNPVQNQGQCGSCWAFSSAAAMESAYFLKHGDLLKLSEQQFVDCDIRCYGCNGGLEVFAFFYAKFSPIETLADYPYVALDETCKEDAAKGKVTVDSYAELYPGVQSELKAALMEKPTCVSVAAANIYFQLYQGGILNTDSCVGQLDHAVTAVGWGTDTDSGQEYLIVRNSWGADWGEMGYIKVALNGDGRGVCGILLDSTTVNVK